MKKKQGKVLAAVALAVTAIGTVHAQEPSVTLYGLIDTAVEHLTNANASGGDLTRMPSLAGGMFPSRIGFRGSEDLGGGLKAIFTLENGFTPDSGSLSQGNRLFGRQAWVGLGGQWGTLTFGRNYNMYYLSTFDVDIFGPSSWGISALDPFIPNGRHDNSIAYKGTFSGFTVGASYSLGRDTSSAGGPAGTNCAGESAADTSACREWSALLRYDASTWGVLTAYDKLHGGAGAAAGLISSGLTDTRLHVAGYAKFGAWKLGAGVVRRDNEGSASQPRSNLSYIGAAYKLTPALTIDGQVARLDYKNSPNDTKQFLVRGLYDLSKRTTVYLLAGHLSNNGTAAVSLSAGASVGAGMSQNGLATGIKHSF